MKHLSNKEKSEQISQRHKNFYYIENGTPTTSALECYHSAMEMAEWKDEQHEKEKQKLAIFIPKFHVGDKLVSTNNPSLTYEVLEVGHINELGNQDYKVEIFTDRKVENPRNIQYIECYKVDEWAELIEQKPAWSEEDEKIIETMCKEGDLRPSQMIWLKSLKDRVQPKQEWGEEDEKMLSSIIEEVYPYGECPDYPTEEKREYYYTHHNMVDWLKSIKDRVQPQQKQEWSKDDEDAIGLAIEALEDLCDVDYPADSFIGYNLSFYEAVERLKGLKPQSHWKPTKEQMSMLLAVLNDSNNITAESVCIVLNSLYNDLKKL